jgi:hypothetical protein
MEIYRKIIILLIVIIFTYIFFRLLNKRQALFKQIEDRSKIEGFSEVGDSEYDSISKNKFYTQNKIKIQSIPLINQNISLKQCCMKASYNSAYTGSYVSLDMIKFVLGRGCRFLDFEVFSIDGVPQVGVSTDLTNTLLTSKNQIFLDNAFNIIVSSAFSNASPNLYDPIFIQLRIKSKTNDVYKQVAKSIENSLKSKLYTGNVTGDTKLSDIMGKVILVMDSSINTNYKNFVTCAQGETGCFDLSKYINIETGGSNWLTYKNSIIMGMVNTPPSIDNRDPRITTVDTLKLVVPDATSPVNPNNLDLVYKYGVQAAENIFYAPDKELYKYEQVFNYYTTAFIPMGYVLSYINNSTTYIDELNYNAPSASPPIDLSWGKIASVSMVGVLIGLIIGYQS